MKKLSVFVLVAVMLGLSAVPALAAGGPPANAGCGAGTCTGIPSGLGTGSQLRYGGQITGFSLRTPFALSGTIAAIDLQAKTVTVAVVCGNRLVDPDLNTTVTLQTSDATRFLLRNADGTVTPISMAELVVGESVSSHGSLVNGIMTAWRVTQGALLSCIQ
jgi:hypothetical protein